jgi:hypothetical protein
MNISEVSAAGKKVAERDKGKADIAAAAASLAVGGMDFEAGGADQEARCGSSGPAICATLFCN